MSITVKNKNKLRSYITQQAFRIEKALIFRLEALVAKLENHAKNNAGYQDQTSKLKGSIGGVLLKDGIPITYKGFDIGDAKGNTEGKDFINTLISANAKGYVIIVVAGMEYATYVENYYNLNVLKKTELKLDRDLPKLVAYLKSKI